MDKIDKRVDNETGNMIYPPIILEIKEELNLTDEYEEAEVLQEETVAEENVPKKLWQHESTLLLIELVKKYDKDMQSAIKKHVWSKIAKEISEKHEITLTPIQTDTKWKGLVKKYKEVIKTNNSTSGKSRMQWEYFDLMNEILFKKPEMASVAITCSSCKGLIVAQSPSPTPLETSEEEVSNLEVSFFKKRKERDNPAERRHKEKMQRLDRLQDSADRMINVLEQLIPKN